MKRNNLFPQIDSKIYLSFGIVFILSLIFLLYQYFHHVNCETANYFIHADEYLPNRVIEFYDNTEGAKSWKWDFGDNTAVDFRQKTLHYYQKPGEYIVKLTINRSCIHEKLVTITNNGQQIGYLPTIIAPNVTFVGDAIKFNAEKGGGKSWEWSFGETFATDALEKSPIYKFKTIGYKKITLIVNGDVEHAAVKTIYVAPKIINIKQAINFKSYEFEKPHTVFSLPMGDAEKDPLIDLLQYISVSPKVRFPKDSVVNVKKASEISNEQFKLLLDQVASNTKTKDDFKDYLCGKFDVLVVINNKDLMPFDQFCQNLAGKKIKITALRINKDSNNCIQNINIHYKVKKWMLWINEKITS